MENHLHYSIYAHTNTLLIASIYNDLSPVELLPVKGIFQNSQTTDGH